MSFNLVIFKNWFFGIPRFLGILLLPGKEPNGDFLSVEESYRSLYSSLMTLDRDVPNRLPLGPRSDASFLDPLNALAAKAMMRIQKKAGTP